MSKDIIYTSDYRRRGNFKYSSYDNKPYDWKSKGVITRTTPSFLLNSNNPILTNIMKAIDMWIVNILLAIEKAAKFKHIMNK